MQRRVVVKSPLLRGKTTEVSVSEGGTVSDLKRAIGKLFPRNKILIIMGGKELKDSAQGLKSVGIRDGVIVNVLAKLHAGPLGGLNPSTASQTTTTSLNDANPHNYPSVASPRSSSLCNSAPMTLSPPSSAPPPPPPTSDADATSMRRKMSEVMAKSRAGKARKSVLSTPVKKAFSADEAQADWAADDGQSEEVGPSKSMVAVASSASSGSPDGGGVGLQACALGSCARVLSALQRYECRCGGLFCTRHRYPEKHRCSFDHKDAARRKMAADNPKPVKASKGSPRLH